MFSSNSSDYLLRFFVVFFMVFRPGEEARSESKSVAEGPDLIVGIVVDKMRYDYLTRMWDRFGDGGFRRLVSEGSSFSNARYDYLINQSAPGYATIFTGANPSAHGIISDKWYDRLRDEMVSAVYSDNAVAVGGSFVNGKRAPSGLLAGTFGDGLRMANDFRSRIFSVSLNDAASIISGGFSANTAWWFDNASGTWMSSSYYIDSLPDWVEEFNTRMLPDTYLKRKWEPVAERYSYFRVGKEPKPDAFQYDLKRMRRRGDDYELLRSIPYGNTFTKDFALNLILNEQLGKRNSADMLIIGFSATAEIDRKYGTFSMEVQDTYLRLDRDIAHLLDFLDEHFGRSRILVFLTSDRAVSYPASYNNYARIPGGTFSPGMAMSLLRSYLNVTYGQGDWVSTYNAGMVYLNHNFVEDNNIQLDEIQKRAARFLNQFSGVAGTLAEDVLRSNYFSSGVQAQIQAGFHPKRSGDIMIYLQQGWFERSLSGDQLSLISYDRHVPLIFYGWNIDSNSFRSEVGVVDIAPTISLLLDIPIAPFTSGKPIMELIR